MLNFRIQVKIICVPYHMIGLLFKTVNGQARNGTRSPRGTNAREFFQCH